MFPVRFLHKVVVVVVVVIGVSIHYRIDYCAVCRDLLHSTSDGIEVSYNACGIFANIMSDGAAAWTITTPSRRDVLRDMSAAISQWKLNTKRNINYR